MNEKIKEVTFISQKVKDSYESLKDGKFEDRELFGFLTRAKEDLLNNPLCGTRIPERLIPKEYITNYGVKALWKYDLPNAWRLIYTIIGDEVKIVSVILEWMTHKEYERRFHY
jgi:hypothetical protein